jgi:hypothetical protein
MIRALRIWIARRRLEKLVAKRRQSFECRDYAKRRTAALKHTRGMA